MNENNKNRLNVQDEQLAEVTGGNYNFGIFVLITTNERTYASGDTPRYSVGQRLKIKCRDTRTREEHDLPCEVLAVSPTKDCGWWFKEFGYKIKILYNNIAPQTIDSVCEDVYEDCLYDN